MAFGEKTLTDAGGAASDLLASGRQAKGLRITAQGTRLQAEGNRVEGENYDLASALAKTNEQFTEQSVAVQQAMANRQIYQAMGETTNEIAGSGFQLSGSGLDILRSNAQQGALQKQMIGQQGLITEAGYNEQSEAFNKLAIYARTAASTEDAIAGEQDALAARTERDGMITGGIKAAAAVATFFV